MPPSPCRCSTDAAAQAMIARAQDEGLPLVWDRHARMQPSCGFGRAGLCCRVCHLGPCRLNPGGDGPQEGVCGASADLIVARNLARMIAAGVAAHADHGREVALTLLRTSENPTAGYAPKDETKLRELAREYGLVEEDRPVPALAADLARAALADFGRQEGEITGARRAPTARQDLWRRLGLTPRGIDREVVQMLHQTTMGVDADYSNVLLQALRAALADGWGGSMIATDLQDVLFGSPQPTRTRTNLGVLRADQVNLVVHGHEPLLADMLAEAARAPELLERARQAGASGINLVGLCCTGHEILMRRGIPSAGSFLHQELALLTGAVEAMVLDEQCVMPALADLARRFHTLLLTTSPQGRMPGVEHVGFDAGRALEIARGIVGRAVDNFSRRQPERVQIPGLTQELVGGFSADNLATLLGGRFGPSYRPLAHALRAGHLRGLVAVVGCENLDVPQGAGHTALVRELLAHDVLVLTTGCSALASARAGLCTPEAALEWAGPGLRALCEALDLPPVLHLGACVDNSRLLLACTRLLAEGGLGDDLSALPLAAAAPEWMSEKAMAIGAYAVASGVTTVFGSPWPVLGSPNVTDFLTHDLDDLLGAHFAFEPDPSAAAHYLLRHLDAKRAALALPPAHHEALLPA